MYLPVNNQCGKALNIMLAEQATGFSGAELNYLTSWGAKVGLEVDICPDGVNYDETAYVGFCDGVARWIIHRSEGTLMVYRCSDEQKKPVATVEAATVIVEDELRLPIPRFFALHLACVGQSVT